MCVLLRPGAREQHHSAFVKRSLQCTCWELHAVLEAEAGARGHSTMEGVVNLVLEDGRLAIADRDQVTGPTGGREHTEAREEKEEGLSPNLGKSMPKA